MNGDGDGCNNFPPSPDSSSCGRQSQRGIGREEIALFASHEPTFPGLRIIFFSYNTSVNDIFSYDLSVANVLSNLERLHA